MPLLERPTATHHVRSGAARRRGGGRRRRLSLLAVVASLLVLTVLPAGAQGPSDPASKEKAEREKTKARSGEVGRELDELNASDVELKAELARRAEADAMAADIVSAT